MESTPVAVLATLSYRMWFGLSLTSVVLYLRHISGASQNFGTVFRVLYGLFGTRFAELVLGYMLLTKKGEPQAEQLGGTTAVIKGPPELRVKIVPILGAAFGGNYSFLIWDEADEQRRALVVDPADPYPVLDAAKAERLNVVSLLNTHWHFDHAAGNRVFARVIPGLQVVASSAERTKPPAVTKLVRDQAVLEVGRLRVRCHQVPGHTQGSLCYEVSNAEAPHVAPAVFTGDAIFCGGCGALFEGSVHLMHAAFQARDALEAARVTHSPQTGPAAAITPRPMRITRTARGGLPVSTPSALGTGRRSWPHLAPNTCGSTSLPTPAAAPRSQHLRPHLAPNTCAVDPLARAARDW